MFISNRICGVQLYAVFDIAHWEVAIRIGKENDIRTFIVLHGGEEQSIERGFVNMSQVFSERLRDDVVLLPSGHDGLRY